MTEIAASTAALVSASGDHDVEMRPADKPAAAAAESKLETLSSAAAVAPSEAKATLASAPAPTVVRPFSYSCAQCQRNVKFPSGLIQSFSCPHCHYRVFVKNRTLTLLSLDV